MDRAEAVRACTGTLWHPPGAQKWVISSMHSHLSCSSIGAQEEKLWGELCSEANSSPPDCWLPVPPVLRHQRAPPVHASFLQTSRDATASPHILRRKAS